MTRAIAVQVILGVLLEIWFSTQAPGYLDISCNSKNCSAYRALGMYMFPRKPRHQNRQQKTDRLNANKYMHMCD